ncbi:MAG: copper resistance protein B [Gammaproteobacteria bacterium]
MKKLFLIALTGYLVSGSAYAGGMQDDPVITKFMVDQLETRQTDGDDPFVLEGQAWIGKDLNKFWLKIDAERVKSDTEELEVQALYSRAIAPFWDFQVGLRTDINPKPTRDWFVLGFQGLAPYFYEIDSAFFINDSGQVGLRLQAEYEILFTQKLILTPEIEVNLHTKDDVEVGTGSGLSDSQIGIRLRYEFKREFAPYIGVNWNNKFGNTATFAKQSGAKSNDSQIVVGLRAWF